jgi:hypothetical protein
MFKFVTSKDNRGKVVSNAKRGIEVALSWVWAVLVFFMGSGQSVSRADSTSSLPPQMPVTDIRFGVIEPPVVAQQDITVFANTSILSSVLKPLECSGMAWVDGCLLLSSDRHGHRIFSCAVDLDTMTIGKPQPHIVIHNEQQLLNDAESITIREKSGGGYFVYVMCSLSNDRGGPLPTRRHILRLFLEESKPFTCGRGIVVDAGWIRNILNEHFQAMKVEPYRTYYADFPGPDKNTYRWGNVEGIAFTPQNKGLLCGMRNPLYEQKALLFVVRGVEDAFDRRDNKQLEVTDLFTVDLGERGVSDLIWDSLTQGYLIAAAKSNGPKLDEDQPFPPNTLDSALFWWSGRKSDPPILFAKAPDMKIEAICRLGSSRFIAICSDEGDVSEGREQRQSVLTILDFRGITPERK